MNANVLAAFDGTLESVAEEEERNHLWAGKVSVALRRAPANARAALAPLPPPLRLAALLGALGDGIERTDLIASLCREAAESVGRPWPTECFALALWAGGRARELGLSELVEEERAQAVGLCLRWGHPEAWDDAVQFVQREVEGLERDGALHALIRARPAVAVGEATPVALAIQDSELRLSALAEIAARVDDPGPSGSLWLGEIEKSLAEAPIATEAVHGIRQVLAVVVAARAAPAAAHERYQRCLAGLEHHQDAVGRFIYWRQLLNAAARLGKSTWTSAVDRLLGDRTMKRFKPRWDVLIHHAVEVIGLIADPGERSEAVTAGGELARKPGRALYEVAMVALLARESASLVDRSPVLWLDRLSAKLQEAALDPEAPNVLSQVALSCTRADEDGTLRLAHKIGGPYLRGIWLLAMLRSGTPRG